MDDTEDLAETIVSVAESAEQMGHTPDAIADALLTAALTLIERTHGPRQVAQRLYLVAERFAAAADAAEAKEADALQ